MGYLFLCSDVLLDDDEHEEEDDDEASSDALRQDSTEACSVITIAVFTSYAVSRYSIMAAGGAHFVFLWLDMGWILDYMPS